MVSRPWKVSAYLNRFARHRSGPVVEDNTLQVFAMLSGSEKCESRTIYSPYITLYSHGWSDFNTETHSRKLGLTLLIEGNIQFKLAGIGPLAMRGSDCFACAATDENSTSIKPQAQDADARNWWLKFQTYLQSCFAPRILPNFDGSSLTGTRQRAPKIVFAACPRQRSPQNP